MVGRGGRPEQWLQSRSKPKPRWDLHGRKSNTCGFRPGNGLASGYGVLGTLRRCVQKRDSLLLCGTGDRRRRGLMATACPELTQCRPVCWHSQTHDITPEDAYADVKKSCQKPTRRISSAMGTAPARGRAPEGRGRRPLRNG